MIRVRFNLAAAKKKLEGIKNGVELAVIATNTELFSDAVAGTPVDTGFARASRWVALDGTSPHPSPPIKTVAGADTPPIAAPGPGPNLMQSGDRRIIVANGASYIRELEYNGKSPQAPDGWVRTAAARYRSNFNRNVRRLVK